MDLEALRAYLAVVETGSFVSAATSLRYARATLRRRVDELEVQAGVPLLHRTGQGATPTEAGRVLAERGRRILAEASALLSTVREIGAEPSGTVRIVLPVGLPPQLFAPMYAVLRARHEKLRLRVRFAEDPMAGLLHDADVAICFGGAPPEGPWISHELLRVPERLIASPAYLRAHGTPSSPADLHAHELLVWEPEGTETTRLPLRGGAELEVTPALASSDIHLLRQCAGGGLGVAFVPDASLPEALVPEPALVTVLDGVVGRMRAVRVVMPAALSEIPRIKAVIDQIHALVVRDASGG
jgi:DNA-binding transcriptional LysR family regulator